MNPLFDKLGAAHPTRGERHEMNVEKYIEAVAKDILDLEEACGMPEAIMASKFRGCFEKHIPVLTGDHSSQKTDDCIYVVMARRWGEEETHSYICGWSPNACDACDIADDEAERRGGKYAGVVYRIYRWAHECSEIYRSKSSAE